MTRRPNFAGSSRPSSMSKSVETLASRDSLKEANRPHELIAKLHRNCEVELKGRFIGLVVQTYPNQHKELRRHGKGSSCFYCYLLLFDANSSAFVMEIDTVGVCGSNPHAPTIPLDKLRRRTTFSVTSNAPLSHRLMRTPAEVTCHGCKLLSSAGYRLDCIDPALKFLTELLQLFVGEQSFVNDINQPHQGG